MCILMMLHKTRIFYLYLNNPGFFGAISAKPGTNYGNSEIFVTDPIPDTYIQCA